MYIYILQRQAADLPRQTDSFMGVLVSTYM